jgi:hypothetical protein
MILPPSTNLRTPGIMTTGELATWAQIGKNAVPMLVGRFGIRELTGNAKNRRYPARSVLRAVLGVSPATQEDMERLLIPLQKATWVAQVTGLSVSTISAAVCDKRGALPSPVELTATGPDQAPARCRRWIPAQIEAHLQGGPIPFLAAQTSPRKTPSKRAPDPADNVFAAICGSNAGVSRQLQL